MIRSMTGFGEASGRDGETEFFVELRSVNNKYFKAIMRLPEALQSLEPELEVALRRRLHRGSVTLSVSTTDLSSSAAFEINHRALDRYVEQLGASDAVRRGSVTLDVGALLGLPGVLQPPADEEGRLDRARDALLPLADAACDRLLAMREAEGGDLAADLEGQLSAIERNLAAVAEAAPEIVRDYEQRLRQRIELLISEKDAAIEPADLTREIAVYAEKTDIAEEVTRLTGHVARFREKLGNDPAEPVGRALEFLTQEMLREANTMASKSPSATLSGLVVEIKAAIDRIKEQVFNVE